MPSSFKRNIYHISLSLKNVIMHDIVWESENSMLKRISKYSLLLYRTSSFSTAITKVHILVKHVQFVTKTTFNSGTSVRYRNNTISNSTNVKILGILMESSCTCCIVWG
jgi:hypothetical protein